MVERQAVMDLIDLMTRPNFCRCDPETSREAGERALSFSATDEADIYACLRLSGVPLAAEEISDRLGWQDHGGHVRVNRRLARMCDCVTDEYGALIRAALIERTEVKHVNRSGRAAFKYRVRQL